VSWWLCGSVVLLRVCVLASVRGRLVCVVLDREFCYVIRSCRLFVAFRIRLCCCARVCVCGWVCAMCDFGWGRGCCLWICGFGLAVIVGILWNCVFFAGLWSWFRPPRALLYRFGFIGLWWLGFVLERCWNFVMDRDEKQLCWWCFVTDEAQTGSGQKRFGLIRLWIIFGFLDN